MDFPTPIEELQKKLISGFKAGRIDEEALKEYKRSGRSLPAEFEITDEILLACAKFRVVLSLPPSQITIDASVSKFLYRKQVEESDGFYVDPKASENINMGIIPFDFNEENEEDPYMIHAKTAIDTFNYFNSEFKLEFVKLLYVTGEVVSGFLLYLTFYARDLYCNQVDTYQSVVWQKCLRYGMPQPAEVLSFRLKPTPGSKKTWFWNNRRCGLEMKDSDIQTTDTGGEVHALLLKLKERTFTRYEADILMDIVRSNTVGLSSGDGES